MSSRRFHSGHGKGWKWVRELHSPAASLGGNPWNAVQPSLAHPEELQPSWTGHSCFPGTLGEQRRPH